ncbi:hypothetical protein VB264_01235 [Arcicella aquatica]|uniref:Uncharacterized protein n=1 Tax=Arcicella aquatica TaxID=217141 RepID=A0ABU5QHG2_9BACT|nr:hypothetical protein [Arcicella aquatica]MEA5256385.1 hypothetical protein [Arcicella aquatica]
MTEEELNARFNVVEKLTNLFKFERMLHLVVTSTSLIILFASIILTIQKEKAGSTELTLMFGSSGLITYAAGRLLRMWDQALKVIVGGKIDEKI